MTRPRALWLLLLLLAGLPDEARGLGINLRGTSGDLVREPTGLKDVVIEREDLKFDLRPLVQSNTVSIEVTYHLHNEKAKQKLSLVFFASYQVLGGLTVLLDGKAVPTALEKSAAPEPPSRVTTPGIEGGPVSFQELPQSARWTFDATLPPGKHQLQVRYKEPLAGHQRSLPLKSWHVVYSLARPAGEGRPERVSVTVHLPEDWLVATQPALTQEGDTLRGSFDKAPDVVALTVRAPLPADYEPTKRFNKNVVTGCLIGGGLLCVVGGGLFGCWLRLRGRSTWWALLLGLALATLWTGALLGAVNRMMTAHTELLPANQRSHAPGQVFEVLFAWVYCLAAFPVGVVLTQLGALIACLIVKRREHGKERERPYHEPSED